MTKSPKSFPTGAEIFALVAHDGAPSDVAANPPEEKPHDTPSLKEAMGLMSEKRASQERRGE